MIELNGGVDLKRPDATFDLDGTVFKLTVLEAFTDEAATQKVFDPLPPEITAAKRDWKEDNTEESYNIHLGQVVRFFIDQVPGKPVDQLQAVARLVAAQQRHRRWNITTAIIEHLRPTHNIMAVSLMPEWLMEPFTEDLGFVALMGSTYVTRDGRFTGEARAIDKAAEYAGARSGDVSQLDIHMGDTIGDKPLLMLAQRPLLFNPSWTLLSQMQDRAPTIITSHKDVATIIIPGQPAQTFGPPFDAAAILDAVQRQK